jgi:ABC-type Zn2+ transport system substrate-binding protein/surface adhesin
MSLIDKVKSLFSGGPSAAADDHAGHDHAGHDHAGHDHDHDHSHDPVPATPEATTGDEGESRQA